MATEIKAIPTLTGNEARRFKKMAEHVERERAGTPQRDITQHPDYAWVKRILNKSSLTR